jgi:hypothetical protein
MQPLRELFVEFYGQFDYEAFEEAEKATDNLVESLEQVPKATDNAKKNSSVLQTNLREFESVLKNAGISTGMFGSAIAALTSPITLAVAAVAGAVVAFGAWINTVYTLGISLYNFTASLSQTGREMISTAQRIGIAESALAAWRAGADEAHIATSNLDGALTDLAQKMGEAVQNPASQVARLFRNIGISTRDLGNMEVEEVFYRLADAIARAEPASERLRLANIAMGGSGKNLVPILMGGSEALRRMRLEHERTHPVFQRFIALSGKFSAAQAKLNDTIEGFKQLIFNIFAPGMIVAINVLTKFLAQVMESPAIIDMFKFAIISLTVAIIAAGATLATVLTLFVATNPILLSIVITLSTLTWMITTVIGALQDFYVYLRGGDSVFGRFVNWTYNVIAGLQDWIVSLFDVNSILGYTLDQFDRLANSILEVYNAWARLAGQPEIHMNLRRTIQDDVRNFIGQSADPKERDQNRIQFSERIRKSMQEATGIRGIVPEQDIINRDRALFDQYRPVAPGSIPTIGTGLSSVSDSALNRASAESRAKNQNTSITQNTTANVTINEATDAARTQQIVEEALNNSNRNITELFGAGAG